MASKAYQYTYTLFRNGTSNTYVVGLQSNGQTVTDAADSSGDDPNVVGDVPNDRFTSTFETYPLTYAGAETSGGNITGGIVGATTVGTPTSYLLYTNVPHAQNEVITADPSRATPVCFTTGTRIRTARGEVAVEDLRAGDRAVTASGDHRPIRWIGRRTLAPRRCARPHEAQPVCIRAGALGENRPVRDLRVSPGHAIAVDVLGEVLIPAFALLNGTTIVQEDVASVTYWHVELDGHDLLVAEGQPAESYLDTGNRAFFAGSALVALTAAPDAARTHADFCRPFHAEGPLVDLVRARLAARADMLRVAAARRAA